MQGVLRQDIQGVIFSRADGRFIRATAHAALTAYVPYLVLPSFNATDADGRAVTAACAAEASIMKIVGVPQKAYAAGEVAELQVEGPCTMLVEGTTDVAAGDYLKIAPATFADAAIKEGAALTNSSVGVACAAQAANSKVATKVQLLGVLRVVNT
jgi:hypothetical protein